jgi:hypothetical protein
MEEPTLKDFLHEWYVKFVDGEEPWLQPGWRLLIGTGEQGATAPWFSEDFETCVGFTILDGQGQVKLSTSQQQEYQEPIYLLYVSGHLRWAGFAKDDQGNPTPLRIYISLSRAEMLSGDHYDSLYGSSTWGDPDQVGVWGADGRPPG